MTEVAITKHREPPPGFDPDSGFGHVRAEGGGIVTFAPVTLDLLDGDDAMVRRCMARMRDFHQSEVDRIRGATR